MKIMYNWNLVSDDNSSAKIEKYSAFSMYCEISTEEDV